MQTLKKKMLGRESSGVAQAHLLPAGVSGFFLNAKVANLLCVVVAYSGHMHKKSQLFPDTLLLRNCEEMGHSF